MEPLRRHGKPQICDFQQLWKVMSDVATDTCVDWTRDGWSMATYHSWACTINPIVSHYSEAGEKSIFITAYVRKESRLPFSIMM